MGSEHAGPDLSALTDIDEVVHAPARLALLTYLYVVESADYVFLIRLTGLSWGNLATHLAKLEKANYVTVTKEFRGKKPHSTVKLTARGRAAFSDYKASLQRLLGSLPG
ncbi:MAG: transcriptional regulator [Candidatus Bipolaricaulis sp.]|nr:transcriptional regulator [Candidatus Bipolaricaulis sp.]